MGQREHGKGVRHSTKDLASRAAFMFIVKESTGDGVSHSTKELASRLRLSGYRQSHVQICCLYVYCLVRRRVHP
jgi:hypothetical protein